LIFGYSRQGQPLEPNITDGEFKEDEKIAFFNNQPVEPLNQPLVENSFLEGDRRVLSATDEEKWIEVDLSCQRLYARQGEKIVYDFPISSGKWGLTPTGEFRIWSKLKYTLMTGGSKSDNTYYYLPNVPYTQYFYQGYGLHGTYWHNNFGQPMSHGCINLYTPDAEKLFYWSNPVLANDQWVIYPKKASEGTRVVVHGSAPRT